jgi:glucose/arabinose dehydrogenase
MTELKSNSFLYCFCFIIFLLLFCYFTINYDLFLFFLQPSHFFAYGYLPEAGSLPLVEDLDINVIDPNLKIEVFATGLQKPTNMAFLDSGDVIVLEKNNGTVRMIANGTLIEQPLLDVNVANFDTRGMLGIATSKNEITGKERVFLYYTEARNGASDGQDKCLSPAKCDPKYSNGNMLYQYDLSDDHTKLTNKKLILNFPPAPGAAHNGGDIIIGPDKNLYLIVGNGDSDKKPTTNFEESKTIDGTGGILALNKNGASAFDKGILGSFDPLNKYYAYGIRNGFGLDFDPITGNLWDTENGPGFGDEINLVKPGFNSGWKPLIGFWKAESYTKGKPVEKSDVNNLVDFDGKGFYSNPEFAWHPTIGITAIKFLNSDKLGKEYENDIFVGSATFNGNLYHFDVTNDREGLALEGDLSDKIADEYEEASSIIFGKGFGVISDITVGPDGYMYIVSNTRGEIFRIVPQTQ